MYLKQEKPSNVIIVSVKDIIDELSKITGIKKDDIGIFTKIHIGYWGTHNFQKLVKLINLENQDLGFNKYGKDKYFNIIIFSNKNFYYDLEFKLDLNEIQADLKPLKEHCTTELYFDDARCGYYTGLRINNIENLNYKINLDELENLKVSNKFFPHELFKQTIINIVESKNKEKQLIKK